MDPAVQRLLNDKLYDRRKQGALELESIIRESLAAADYKRIGDIVHQLCDDYAYATNTSHARNGGLIGLAAAAIALGSDDVGRYLKAIVPPVLACFTDQDARVRYYACESMYNIAKVAKGEILVFFNDVFDALCKLAADSELSVKNGAELLDRLIKDIVSESASTYVSVVIPYGEEPKVEQGEPDESVDSSSMFAPPTAFSLPKFIPLLKERIYVINPFTRTFLVSWVTLLDSIPDLELVTYLPEFLGGLFKFLNDPNRDVHVATQGALERFLNEIKKIAKIKRGIVESRKTRSLHKSKKDQTSDDDSIASARSRESGSRSPDDGAVSFSGDSEDDGGDWIPGQDTLVEYPRILEILVTFLDPSSEEEIRLTSLRWIDSFFDICPEEILPFVPRLLSYVLPAMASTVDHVRQTANRVNASLMDYISRLPDEYNAEIPRPPPLSRLGTGLLKDSGKEADNRAKNTSTPAAIPAINVAGTNSDKTNDAKADAKADAKIDDQLQDKPKGSQQSSRAASQSPKETLDLDYGAAVGALTLHFLAEHEATRVASLNWLIMLHRKAPRKVLATNDGTFPALLKTLSDPDEAVVTKDLQLLAQISRNSDDTYFTSFIENVLQLFGTDRRLLQQRGNLIIRQLCGSLNAERIYRTLANCLEKVEDLEFAMIMVQSLNNNLITAPQLSELRKRLRNMDSKEGQTLFVTLFRSWCYNAVATFSLCLLAQAYEQAYHLLQIMGEMEMTVQMLIEIDKLVQLLESPVFTYLRLQLLEPERFPYLYKCLYGVLMLLPQSAAFAALKNRLNSVSAIGYLHMPGRPHSYGTMGGSNPNASSNNSLAPSRTSSDATPRNSPQTTNFPERGPGGRLKSRDEGIVRWPELLEKFRAVQERARKARKGPLYFDDEQRDEEPEQVRRSQEVEVKQVPQPSGLQGLGTRGGLGGAVSAAGMAGQGAQGQGQVPVLHKPRGSLGGFKQAFTKSVAKGKRG